jgi:cell division transport system permease protein
MLFLFFKRAIQDIIRNRFLNVVTIVTIALSILIVSAFVLFIVNVNDMMDAWKQGIRIMAYLEPGLSEAAPLDLKNTIQRMDGVVDAQFISKTNALNQLKQQMKRQSSLFKNLKENPLPDAFEIHMVTESVDSGKVERLAGWIESLPEVAEVEYGQSWLGKYTNIINLFKLTGYALSCLFFMAAIFIVANTIRLVLYSRQEEVEIMRLVGAADSFIKTPFYIEGLILGALGGSTGLITLYGTFLYISASVTQGLATTFLTIRFFPPMISCSLIGGCMLIGWLGCYLSLKQFMKV